MQQKIKTTSEEVVFIVAAELGFEPRQYESES